MIQVSVDTGGLKELIKELKKINKDLLAPNLQVYRAQKFKEYTKNLVRTGQAGLKKISPATTILTGEHDPMYLTGKLIEMMSVKAVRGTKGGYGPGYVERGQAADVGYFENSPKVPGKSITWTKLAILHHTGYRIPLTGEKGRKVRAWLAMNGINLFGTMGTTKNKADMWRHDRAWIHVPPRPFMFHSLEKYIAKDMDLKAVDEYLNTLTDETTNALANKVMGDLMNAYAKYGI